MVLNQVTCDSRRPYYARGWQEGVGAPKGKHVQRNPQILPGIRCLGRLRGGSARHLLPRPGYGALRGRKTFLENARSNTELDIRRYTESE